MNVLILGSGGRESALAWKLSQSKLMKRLFIAQGNAGTSEFGTNISISETDFPALRQFVVKNDIEMLVPGSEAPLAEGIVDFFRADPQLNHLKIIGPPLEGALLESSKDFAKRFMAKYKIPTASYATFGRDEIEEGYLFLESLHPPFVLKADGLAAGKGVVICHDLDSANKELRQMLIERKFGAASDRVVIEEFLHGIELSVFVLTDGKNYIVLPEAKDYKRIGDNDQGPNTGGMGAVSPVPFADSDFMSIVDKTIIKPTISGLQLDNIPYCGFIFFGIMNCDGVPYVIEYNVRMGDPEAEVVLPRIKSDLLQLFELAATSKLNQAFLEIEPETAVAIVMASGGYPGLFEKGKIITINKEICSEAFVFFAGAAFDANNQLITSGGRVVIATSLGASLADANNKAYRQLSGIGFENAYYRKDIGHDLMKWQQKAQS